MSHKSDKMLAKEIIDRAVSFKQEKTVTSSGQEEAPKTGETAEDKYKPSANFDKIFSGLIISKQSNGENIRSRMSRPNSLPKPSDNQNFSPNNTDFQPKEQPPEKAQSPQIETKQEEPTNSPPSIFQRLSKEQPPEKAQSPQIETKQEEPTNSPPSIFQRLSKEQPPEKAQSPQIETKQEEPTNSPPSIFQRLSKEQKQEEKTNRTKTLDNSDGKAKAKTSVFKRLSR